VGNNTNLTEDEIVLIARVTYAEAGICSDYCQRLIIDAILNQVDNSNFPNTVNGVIYKKGNFDVIANGSAYKYPLSENTLRLVREEAQSRTNYEVLYFRNNHYHSFGTPVTHVDNVYFSK
jgi:N-acetylmuramoyl-L-alanine amidase